MPADRFRSAMTRAIELAAAQQPHPNPRVGSVVLDREGRVIGEGAHVGPGHPHAEVAALDRAGPAARGGTMVVNVEPCNHHGRTPPCTEALLTAGVSRVVVALRDPDPRVAGSGIARLRKEGVEIVEGLLADEAEAIDPGYFHHRRTGRPLLTLKAALTLDGQTAAADGTSQWITGVLARADAHRLRARVDAVVIGAGTLIADNPRLDVRLPQYRGPQPRPVVVAGRRPLPEMAALWERNPIVVTTMSGPVPGEALVVGSDSDGLPDLSEAVLALGAAGLLDLLVEGGPTLARRLWERSLIDRGIFYFAGALGGGTGRPVFDGLWPTLDDARAIEITEAALIGNDLKVQFRTRDS